MQLVPCDLFLLDQIVVDGVVGPPLIEGLWLLGPDEVFVATQGHDVANTELFYRLAHQTIDFPRFKVAAIGLKTGGVFVHHWPEGGLVVCSARSCTVLEKLWL